MSSTDQYAVFGHPISHSKSPKIHAAFAAQCEQNMNYRAQDVDEERFESELRAFFEAGGHGINCTIPLKQLAFDAVRTRSARAIRAGAVNTILRDVGGELYGDNTDGVGLMRDLTQNLGVQLAGRRVLVLGAGGAVRGILEPVLASQPECLVVANRTLERAAQLTNEFADLGDLSALSFDAIENRQFDLVLNATAASLQNALPPLPANLLLPGACCYDLAYGNEPTPFVRWAEERGAALAVDGLGMLVEQAAEAFYLWRNVRPNTQSVIAALRGEALASG